MREKSEGTVKKTDTVQKSKCEHYISWRRFGKITDTVKNRKRVNGL